MLSINDIDHHENIEDLWLSIQCRKLPSFIIGCVYRHPHAPVSSFSYLSNIFKSISLHGKAVFILGDINDNLFNPDSKLQHVINTSKLEQLVTKATRITRTSATLLDVIITNKSQMVIRSDVHPTIVADHELVTLTLNLTKPKRIPQVKTFRSRKNYSPDVFCNTIMDNFNTLNEILATDNVNKQVEIFNTVFIKCLDSCAPVVTQDIKRPEPPWITPLVKYLMGKGPSYFLIKHVN